MKRIFVAGHKGMVGSAICRQLQDDPSVELLVAERAHLDLTRQEEVEAFFASKQIDRVFLAAAKVGGIHANNAFPADFLYENLMIQSNVISAAARSDVEQLLFLGSSCIYPKHADQPMSESSLMTGPLEPTNEPYAVAKIAGIKLCESYNRQYDTDFRSVMPTNLFGPGDNFHPDHSHVIPALLRKFHDAKLSNLAEVSVWGTGRPKREFLHVDDMASAAIFVANLSKRKHRDLISERQSHINVGTGIDCSIKKLSQEIAAVTGFSGGITFDHGKPDGAPRKLLDVSLLMGAGWSPSIDLRQGLRATYDWFLEHQQQARGV